ncbi:MAG: hypothetical protein ACOCTT_04105 [archaeon]
MPKLSESTKTTTIELPSIKGSKVKIKEDIPIGEIEEVYDSNANKMAMSLKVLVKVIQEWNLENDNGEIAEINLENVKKLGQKDVMAILKKSGFVNQQDFINAEEQK